MHAALFDAGPFFDVPTHQFAGLGSLPVFAVLGVICGLAAVLIAKGLFLAEPAAPHGGAPGGRSSERVH
jgi:hypothetical protein